MISVLPATSSSLRPATSSFCLVTPFSDTSSLGRSPLWPPPPGPLCALVLSGSKWAPALPPAMTLPSFSPGAQLFFSCRWNPCSPGGSPLRSVMNVTPSLPSETVIVPADLPTPSAVMKLIGTLSFLAAYAGAVVISNAMASIDADRFIGDPLSVRRTIARFARGGYAIIRGIHIAHFPLPRGARGIADEPIGRLAERPDGHAGYQARGARTT